MRLIDADELKKNFQDELCKGIACDECSLRVEGFCRAERWIDIAPTIDAITAEEYSKIINDMVREFKDYKPVKHGRWLPYGEWQVECSECGLVTTALGEGLYCPHCGAKMDEVEE